MFVTGPDVNGNLRSYTKIRSAKTHTSKSGVAHGAFGNDVEALGN